MEALLHIYGKRLLLGQAWIGKQEQNGPARETTLQYVIGLQYHKGDITNRRKDGISSSSVLTLSHRSHARITSSVTANEAAITPGGSKDVLATVLLLWNKNTTIKAT